MRHHIPAFTDLIRSAMTNSITSDELASRLEDMQETIHGEFSRQDTRVKYETHLVPVLRIEIKNNPDVDVIRADFDTLFRHVTTRRLNRMHFGVIAATLIGRYRLHMDELMATDADHKRKTPSDVTPSSPEQMKDVASSKRARHDAKNHTQERLDIAQACFKASQAAKAMVDRLHKGQ